MKLSTNGFIAACLILIFALFSTLWAINAGWFDRNSNRDRAQIAPTSDQTTQNQTETQNPPPEKRGWNERGGVLRPPSDFAKAQNQVPQQHPEPTSNVGVSPILPANLNPNTESIAIASETKRFPERLSVMIEPPPFDKEKFLNDPQKYLDVVEPGRVFQVANKGPDTRPIGETGQQYFELLQGESANLSAVTDPGMPVTFYSGRLGQFENGLAVQTLRADENGIATAKFTASTGTQGEIDIFAGSPTRSGNARYLISIEVPEKPIASSPSDNKFTD